MNLADPVEVLAGTAWGDNRAHGYQGLQSVMNVVMNRIAHPRWWGHDVLSVCLAPWQFSCWNADDPNRPQIMALTPADSEFALAFGLAKMATQWRLLDITDGADSYFDASMRYPPEWAARAVHTCDIGSQRFYRVELSAENGEPDAPNVRVRTADDLNDEELARIANW
jgi:hypothetical protein